MTLEEIEQMEAYCASMRKELERQQSGQDDEWLSYKQLIAEYDFPGIKSVHRADWRTLHNFYPCKSDAKGCQLRINRRLLENWLAGGKYSLKDRKVA